MIRKAILRKVVLGSFYKRFLKFNNIRIEPETLIRAPRINIFFIVDLLIAYQIYKMYKNKGGFFSDFGLEEKPSEAQTELPGEIKFADIVGIDEYKEELEDIIKYFQNEKLYQQHGAYQPKGILLYGKPGTGKTMLAKALANEAGVSFYYKAGSEFDSKYRG